MRTSGAGDRKRRPAPSVLDEVAECAAVKVMSRLYRPPAGRSTRPGPTRRLRAFSPSPRALVVIIPAVRREPVPGDALPLPRGARREARAGGGTRGRYADEFRRHR